MCPDSFIVPLPLSTNRSKYFSVASSSLSQFNGAAFDPLVSCGSLGLADGSKVQRKQPQGVLTQEHPQFVSTYHKNENWMYILNPEQSFVNFIILDDPNVNDS